MVSSYMRSKRHRRLRSRAIAIVVGALAFSFTASAIFVYAKFPAGQAVVREWAAGRIAVRPLAVDELLSYRPNELVVDLLSNAISTEITTSTIRDSARPPPIDPPTLSEPVAIEWHRDRDGSTDGTSLLITGFILLVVLGFVAFTRGASRRLEE